MHKALLQEIQLKTHVMPQVPETIYFGGGTPSYIEPAYIGEILQLLLLKAGTVKPKEVTLEANPDDMDEARLSAWKRMGITRLSVGVQSFFDHHLKWMNRAHSSAEAIQALKRASEIGFELSVDLIFGVPGCTESEWISNLETVFQFNIVHLSCYGLTLEEHTPWNKLIERGTHVRPDEGNAAAQFGITMDFMRRKGWWHYEISNYCQPGKTAVHNTSYWQGKSYVGLGPSAHSFNSNTRSWNVSDMAAYMSAVATGKVPETTELLGSAERHNEYVMTSLRTMWGCNLNTLSAFGHYNDHLRQIMEDGIQKGMLYTKGDVVFLSEQGKYYADAIAAGLFADT